MSGVTLLFIIGGFAAFGTGAYLAASGDRSVGIALMGAGLAFQVVSLRRLRIARNRPGGGPR